MIVEVPISRTEGHPRGEGYRLAVRCPWGPLLDRLNVVAEADRRGVRPIGPGGYTGGPCYRALVETLLAGGDVPSSRPGWRRTARLGPAAGRAHRIPSGPEQS